jgi:hypothetical protein
MNTGGPWPYVSHVPESTSCQQGAHPIAATRRGRRPQTQPQPSPAQGRRQEGRPTTQGDARQRRRPQRARVAGDIHAIFEHIEPRADGVPTWLDPDVPDDRFVASALLLQSAHPGSKLYAATSDINLQTKLAAVGLPYVQGHAAT